MIEESEVKSMGGRGAATTATAGTSHANLPPAPDDIHIKMTIVDPVLAAKCEGDVEVQRYIKSVEETVAEALNMARARSREIHPGVHFGAWQHAIIERLAAVIIKNMTEPKDASPE